MDKKSTAGMYIHIPFCISKCKYCSFVSVPLDGHCDDRVDGYMKRLYQEMDIRRDEWDATHFDTLFVGGGTPSVLPVPIVSNIIRHAMREFSFSGDCEITVEANPESFTPQKAYDYASAGVNRLSFGVQSTHESELKLLGRPHTWADAQNALDYGRMAGIRNSSMDLIYNLPKQSTADYLGSVRRVLDLGIGHLSCYALSLEEGTPLLDAVQRKKLPTPDCDVAADMWERTQEVAKEYGLLRYEISNYAKDGLQSKHNLHYWQQDGYLGLGVAAHSAQHGRDHILRMHNTGILARYMQQGPMQRCEKVAGSDLMFEYVMLQTRLSEGFLLDDFQSRFGQPFESAYASAVQRAVSTGMANMTKERFYLTNRGMMMQNAVLQWFMSVGDGRL